MSVSLSDGGLIPAPVTLVECAETRYDWSNGSLLNGRTVLGQNSQGNFGFNLSFPMSFDQTWRSDATPLLAVWNSSTGSSTLWIEPPDFGLETPSVGIVFFPSLPSNQSAEIVTCSLLAS